MTDDLFLGFWQAAFEGADYIDADGRAVDVGRLTEHDRQVDADYRALRMLGFRSVRECVGWRLASTTIAYDFSRAIRYARAARTHGLQLLWSFCRYGLPAGCSPLDANFVDRFASYCGAAARALSRWQRHALVVTPIDDISFFTWQLTRTQTFGPALQGADHVEVESALVAASRAGGEAILTVAPDTVLMFADSLDASAAADYATWSRLLAPRWPLVVASLGLPPGGRPHGGSDPTEAETREPLHRALVAFGQRYHKPLVVSATNPLGPSRADPMLDLAREVALAIEHGADIRGICVSPVLARPDRHDVTQWQQRGLWDLRLEYRRGRPVQRRVLDRLYARGLDQARNLCPPARGLVNHPRKEFVMGNRRTVDSTDVLPLVVYSHLRWRFVYQRPQHVMSRLADHWPIIFVEEPLHDPRDPWLEHATPAPNVHVITPHTPLEAPGFNDAQCRIVQPLLQAWWQQERLPEGIAWFYTPMALGMLAGTAPRMVVYDCMDELSAFRHAPAEMRIRERELFARADLVFTGGPSLQRAKAAQHARVHCFPSSVDVEHFAQARASDLDHPAQAALARPRLGFVGVIDERFDLDLLRELAARRPDWEFVMVGPVVKIPEAVLPRAGNIHYLGQQPYEALPNFIAGWDVCLLPFALNDSTRHISPTKTLEYLAGGKPVVSTPIADVVELYGPAVRIAEGPDAFERACADALTSREADPLRQAADALLRRTSWRRTVSRMRRLLQSSLTQPTASVADTALSRRTAQPAPLRSTVIIGAGPTGLSAAYHLDADTLVLERQPSVGGWCRSIEAGGFTFDYAGHIMFSNDPYVLRLYEILLGDNVHWQNREAWIYSHGVHTRYPFQSALYGLPPAVLKECLVGAVEAHMRRATGEAAEKAPNFERFILDTWGSGVARHFAEPYNRKLWTVPLDEMETSWLGGRVPLPDLEQMIEGAVSPSIAPQGPNARFGYPLRGGFQALMDGFLPHIAGEVELGAEVIRVHPERHAVELADGRRYRYEQLVSTAPLPRLIALMGDAAPASIKAAAAGLRHVSVRCVHLGIGRPALTDKHWIYYPGDTVFHRVFVQGNASPLCNAPGGFGLTCEISHSEHKPLPCTGEALIERCIEDCIRVGLFTREDPVWVSVEVDMPCAYVIYDHTRARHVGVLRDWLATQDIVLAGRYAEWQYYNSDHAFLAGRRAAEQVKARQRERGQQRRPALAGERRTGAPTVSP